MKKIYFVITLLLIHQNSFAQRNLGNDEWNEWEQASKRLEAGDFDAALRIYSLHDEPNFKNRLKQTQQLKQLYSEGVKLQKNGRFAEAITLLKKHRSMPGIGSLNVFEYRIDECVKQVELSKGRNSSDLEKRIIANELAYRGQKMLRIVDTIAAFRDFTMAKQLGGNLPQYEEGLRVTKELRTWGKSYNESKVKALSLEDEKDLLESYRKIKAVPVLTSIEIKIKSIVAKLDGKNTLLYFAQNCEADLLFSYLNENKSKLSFSETSMSTLRQYKSMLGKVDSLRADYNNAMTVRSAFFSMQKMVGSLNELPDDVVNSLKNCIQNEKLKTFGVFAEQALKSGNVKSAEKFNNFAREIKEVSVTPDCIDLNVLQNDVKQIEQNLLECNEVEANKIWERLNSKFAHCPEKSTLLNRYEYIFLRLNNLSANRRRFATLKLEAQRFLIAKNFKGAKEKFLAMGNLQMCDTAQQRREVREGLAKIKDTNIKPFLTLEFVGGVGVNKPEYKTANAVNKMSYGAWTSGGIQLSLVDHVNPIDFVGGLEYINTNYYSLDESNRAIEKFKITGLSGSLSMKFHKAKTTPNKLRVYLKIGAEGVIPMSYKYDNFYSSTAIKDRSQLKKIIPSVQGGIGLEKQTLRYGYFIEGSANYGLNGMYNINSQNSSTILNSKVDAKFRRATLKIGFHLRPW